MKGIVNFGGAGGESECHGASCKSFGKAHNIGERSGVAGCPPLPCFSEAGHNFVGNDENVGCFAFCHYLFEGVGGVHNHTRSTLYEGFEYDTCYVALC